MASFLIEQDTYDGSFDGVGFMEQYSSGYAVEPDSSTNYTLTSIPGGNKFTTDVMGTNPDKLDLTVALAGAQLALLRSKARNAVRGSLVYHAGTTSARLMAVKGVRSQMVDDAYLATLEFVMG